MGRNEDWVEYDGQMGNPELEQMLKDWMNWGSGWFVEINGVNTGKWEMLLLVDLSNKTTWNNYETMKGREWNDSTWPRSRSSHKNEKVCFQNEM